MALARRKGVGIAIALAVAVLAVAALISWRNATGSSAQDAVLKIGDQRGGAQALLRAAGELDNVPYRIEWALFPAASPLLEALDAGAIDVGGIGGAPFAFAYGSGARIKAIHAYRPNGQKIGKASAIVVPKGSPIRTVADLKGKKLATIRGSAGQDLVLRLLQREGIKPDAIRWVYLNNGESKAALAAGSVDAWSTWGSYVGIAVLEDGDRVVADASGLPSGVGFYAASDKAVATKRTLLEDYVQRLTRARIWARNHPRDYAQVLAKETGIPFEVALFSVEALLGDAVPITPEVVAEQRAIFERYRAAGIIQKLPDLNGGYDASFNAALARAPL